ncbi:hypothetical protein L6164_001583 [Bauhinia variegata]|uniref:Uncharacterized protein n=1 Tax=Bauhinia variegata TaxID=167791 RepID=A0ACB9QA89_BAUVA|nr:hypothetical protein L6164_001583 [Bauhinia variegata]
MEDPQLHPQSLPASDSRHTRVMGKLRDSLLSELAASNPSISVNSDYGSHIQRRLQELFSSFNTPSHPPYALMIQRALIDLNDATGSTKEAISEFIKREYKDLPWAHMAILGHHLRKLCDAGELLCTESRRYRVYNGNLGAGGEINRALEWSEYVEREKELQGQENEKQTQVSVLQIIETNEPSRMQEAHGGWIQEEVEAHEHSIERSEEQNKSGKGFLGTNEQKSLPQRQEIRVIAESEAENFQNIKIQQTQVSF